ncbi:hypothetical protein [Prosthecobacter vanneervenii]|uniref:Uncharacterized protein n=1 Tax=Prosthecobacter vanneervenii TaxID=48466 RepID=A0A7W8DIY1_9BACT|nr:hypothetical protein [Prosthecobacter vanneervenii]MBB5031502.1 hypothetical protein [Prosthecobacter vanneervenii]
MKLPHHDTIAAFEQPSVRNWLVVFICGFLTVCIISPVVYALLLLLRLVAAGMKIPLPATLQDLPLPFVVRITLLAAAGFGTLLATLMIVELARRKQQEYRVKGQHLVFGPYEHSPYLKRWRATSTLPSGDSIRVEARGASPSELQAAVWQQFIARYDTLSTKVTRALLTPPHPLEGCGSISLTPDSVTLSEDGHLHLGFHFMTKPEAFWNSEVEEPIPVAVFSPRLELESTEWIRPLS